MAEVITDLHIHSKYARACSKELNPANLATWADRKGIHVLGTGDFTHPTWLAELKAALVEDQPGLFKLSSGDHACRFMLTTEVSCIYKRGGKTRRVHHLVFAPSFAVVDALVDRLEARGCNLRADGRPIIGLDSEELLKLVLDASPECLLVPAHAWTPWFAVFGSMSGFDALEECFGSMAPHVTAIETGLSSDPAMNWMVRTLDDILLISNSDAHSLGNLGREANVFSIEPDKLSYGEIIRILREKDREKFLYTIEFFPEEGMYHFDGHRACKLRWHPSETKKQKGLCTVCKKPVTVGVLSRVNDLADRAEGERPPNIVPYRSVVPLAELIAQAMGRGVATKGVQAAYLALTDKIPEFHALLRTSFDELATATSPEVVEAVRRMRLGKVSVEPGFDGQYGTVHMFSESERKKKKQESLLQGIKI